MPHVNFSPVFFDTEHKMAFSYFKEYLRETTVHGFRYIADARNALERIFWLCIVAAGFSIAAVMVAASLKDTGTNPIATSVETIPVQEIPFPAVSLKAAKVHNAKRLLEQTLNTFKYDCFTAADDEVHKCRDESARFRQDFRPYIKKAIRDRYDGNYRELKKLVNGQDIYNKHPAYDAATFICKESLSMVQMEHRYWGHINTILFWLDDGGDNIEVIEDELIDLVVDSFRLPPSQFFGSLSKVAGDIIDFEFEDDTACTASLEGFGEKALLITASILSMLGDEVTLPVGRLLTTRNDLEATYLSLKGLDQDNDASAKHEEVLERLATVPGHLVLSQSPGNFSRPLSIDDVFRYAEAAEPGIPIAEAGTSCPVDLLLLEMNESPGALPSPLCEYSMNNRNCCQLEEDLSNSKYLVLKLAKYTLQPVSRKITEKGEINDLSSIGDIFNYTVSAESLENFEPVLSVCRINGKECDSNFDRLFSTDGIGYTFNHDMYRNVYKETLANRFFFDEVYGKVQKETDVTMIKGHGQAFSLELYVRKATRYFDSQSPGNFLTIHSPFEMADFGGTVLELEPGWTYVIYVYPSMTDTYDDALSLDVEDRQCLASDDHNDLKVFNHYTQTACLYECRLSMAARFCNCTPWDYILYDQAAPLCSRVAADDCFQKILNSAIDPSECNCPGNCKAYKYDQSVTKQATKYEKLCIEHLAKESGLLDSIPNSFFTQARLSGEKFCYEELRDKVSIVRVVIASPVATKTARTRRVTFAGQLANLGGIIGLFSGMSILSLVEALFWSARGAAAWLSGGGEAKTKKKPRGGKSQA